MQTTEIHSPQLFLVIIVVQLFVEAALGFLLLIQLSSFYSIMHLGLIWVYIVMYRCYFDLTTAILFCYEFSIHKWNKWHCFRFHPIEVGPKLSSQQTSIIILISVGQGMLTTFLHTIKFCYGFSLKTQSKSYTLSLTERVCEFQNNALSDTV